MDSERQAWRPSRCNPGFSLGKVCAAGNVAKPIQVRSQDDSLCSIAQEQPISYFGLVMWTAQRAFSALTACTSKSAQPGQKTVEDI